MSETPPDPLREPFSDRRMQFALAVAAVLATAVARWPLHLTGYTAGSPFLMFSVAILVAAWFGGWIPGLVATALAGLVADFFFIDPTYSVTIHQPEVVVALVLFLAQGVLISWLGASRVKAANQARTLLKELEDRVAQRTSSLQSANERLHQQGEERDRDREVLRQINARLEQSNRELQDFASVASHDLQEPLRKIRAFGDRLQQRSAEQFSPEGRDYLERMLKAAERMQVLINDLLTFSRVTTKAQPFSLTDLNDVLGGVLSDLESRIEEMGATVETQPLPTIDADPVQIRQLLQNLISNALKFRRPDVQSVIRIYGEEGTKAYDGNVPQDVLRLHVEDNGIGFEEKYLDRIFNVFQRLHGRQHYEGTGIGLAVCRKIARRHGGDITARSVPGSGTTFIVTLPVSHPQGSSGHDATGVFPALRE